ncbi:MAG: hypothetical protein FD175_597 [Beijerinckiaceae bacterium]|nr:MAG: hypothetical protein FD175_597 [Beijerinckiaceae bacterium]
MPKAYIVGRVSVNDLDTYKLYAAKATEAIAKYGGKFLARGGTFEIVEGEGRTRNVVIEFESFEAAKTYFFSPEYTEARKIRFPVSIGDFVIVEGV